MDRRFLRVGLSLALVVGVAACGDDDDDDARGPAGGGGDNTLTITEREYEFDVEGDVVAGNLSIAVTNNGAEIHEIGMAKLTDGTTIDDVRAAAEQVTGDEEEDPFEGLFEEDARIDDLGGSQFPGSSYTISGSDIPAGDYALVCFIPNTEGKPHFSLGMVTGFTIGEGESASAPDADVTYTATDEGLEGPETLEAGETTIEVVNDSSVNREIFLVKLQDGKTVEELGTWFEAADEGPPDPSTAPVEFFAFVFDGEQDRSITLELTPGQWGIQSADPEKPFEGPPDQDPHAILFTVT